jgi:hypothetical protein
MGKGMRVGKGGVEGMWGGGEPRRINSSQHNTPDHNYRYFLAGAG